MAKGQGNCDEVRAETLKAAVPSTPLTTMALGRVSEEYSFTTLKKALY